MTKKNGVNHSMQLSVVSRRKRVIERLELKLKRNTKFNGKFSEICIELSDADKNRIKKEIEILKARV